MHIEWHSQRQNVSLSVQHNLQASLKFFALASCNSRELRLGVDFEMIGTKWLDKNSWHVAASPWHWQAQPKWLLSSVWQSLARSASRIEIVLGTVKTSSPWEVLRFPCWWVNISRCFAFNFNSDGTLAACFRFAWGYTACWPSCLWLLLLLDWRLLIAQLPRTWLLCSIMMVWRYHSRFQRHLRPPATRSKSRPRQTMAPWQT